MTAQSRASSGGQHGDVVRLVALAACLGVLALALMQGGVRHDDALPEAPPLPMPDVACDVAPALAAARARNAEASAAEHVARYPFAPRETLAAAAAFAYAASCHSRAGDARASAVTRARGRAWHARVERDYADHVLRYRLAISSGRVEQLAGDESYLLELLATEQGPFAQWLRHAHSARGSAEEDER